MANQNYTTAVQLAEVADWQINPSEKTFLLVKSKLRSYISAMQQAVLQAEASHRSAMEQEKSDYERLVVQRRQEILLNPEKRAVQEQERRVQFCLSKQQSARKDGSGKIPEINFRTDNWFIKFIGSFIERGDADQLAELKHGREQLAREDMAVTTALERVREKAAKLKDAKVQLYSRQLDEELRQAYAEHQLRQTNLTNEYQNEMETIVSSYRKEFSRYFNNQTFTTAYAMVGSTMRQAVGYSCSDKIPGRLYLGNRTFVIRCEKGDFVSQIISMFRGIEHSAVSASGNQIRITLPFFRTLEEGYSLYLDVKDAAVGTSNRVVWEYVMKAF